MITITFDSVTLFFGTWSILAVTFGLYLTRTNGRHNTMRRDV